VIDGSPQNGLYTGMLRRVPQGGWYRLQVRSGLTPWVIEKGVNLWGVGLLDYSVRDNTALKLPLEPYSQ
jgi:hypothetical protein